MAHHQACYHIVLLPSSYSQAHNKVRGSSRSCGWFLAVRRTNAGGWVEIKQAKIRIVKEQQFKGGRRKSASGKTMQGHACESIITFQSFYAQQNFSHSPGPNTQ